MKKDTYLWNISSVSGNGLCLGLNGKQSGYTRSLHTWSLHCCDCTCHLPSRLKSLLLCPGWTSFSSFWRTWPLCLPLLWYLHHTYFFSSPSSPLDTELLVIRSGSDPPIDFPIIPRTVLAVKLIWRDLTQNWSIMSENWASENDHRKLLSASIFFLFRLYHFPKSPL